MQESKKNDYKDNKLRWDLLPLEEVEEVVEVYTKGSEKYGDNTWQNLENGYQRYKGALLRHLVEYEKGDEVDDETGCRHLAQVAWNAIAMLYCSKHTSYFQKLNESNTIINQDTLLRKLESRIATQYNKCDTTLKEIEKTNKQIEKTNKQNEKTNKQNEKTNKQNKD